MIASHPPSDRFEFLVRFLCGALLGCALAHGAWPAEDASSWHRWLILGGGGVLFGTLAGWFGDPFWRALLGWRFWW